MFYTGIGSRQTPDSVLEKMREIGRALGSAGYTLRSGKAQGADTAFQLGCQDSKGASEIYVPWKGFGRDTGYNPLANQLDHSRDVFVLNSSRAYAMAQRTHPAWDKCSRGAQALHTRNMFQVLGSDLETPSSFVVYWAVENNGIVKGGTASAVKLARENNIPTINLFFSDWRDKFYALQVLKVNSKGQTFVNKVGG